jgi:hypothetical protein
VRATDCVGRGGLGSGLGGLNKKIKKMKVVDPQECVSLCTVVVVKQVKRGAV